MTGIKPKTSSTANRLVPLQQAEKTKTKKAQGKTQRPTDRLAMGRLGSIKTDKHAAAANDSRLDSSRSMGLTGLLARNNATTTYTPGPELEEIISGLRCASRGHSGPAVEHIQRLLKTVVDGKFGKTTDKAVRQFQKTHGLVVDGKVGQDTLGALEARAKQTARLREYRVPARGDSGAPLATPGEMGMNPFHQKVTGAALESVKELGPGEIKSIEPLQLLDGVKDGDVTLEIPLKAGDYKARGVKFTVEDDTVMRVQMQVRDGALVPAKDSRGKDTGGGCKVEIEPAADLPLWLTGRGAYLRERGEAEAQFKADIGGFFDLNIQKRGSAKLTDVVKAFQEGGVAKGKRSRAAKKSEHPPLPKGLLRFDQMKFDVGGVSLKQGELDVGPAKLDIAAGSKLKIKGDADGATMHGQVRLNSLGVNQDGFAVNAGEGSAKVNSRYQRQPDGTMLVETQISQIKAQIKGVESERLTGDGQTNHLSLGPSAIENGSINLKTTLAQKPDGDLPHVVDTETKAHFAAKGQLLGARMTLKDGRDDAEVVLGPGQMAGSVDIDGGDARIEASFKGQYGVRDLQTAKGASALDVHHLWVNGEARVMVDSGTQDFDLAAKGAIDLQVDDYRGYHQTTDVDLNTTRAQGEGQVKVSREGGVQIDGDFKVKGGFDDLKVRTESGVVNLDFAQGSALDADLSHLSAGGDRPFALKAKGEVDIGLEQLSTKLPGLTAKGDASVKGYTEVEIGKGQVFFTNSDATVSVNLADARVAPGGDGFSLDAGAGSKLDLNVRELKSSSNSENNSLKLGAGSRLDAVLDGGQIKLGQTELTLEQGSRARFDIEQFSSGAGKPPQLRGSLVVNAAVEQKELARQIGNSASVSLSKLPGVKAQTEITVKDVVLGGDGQFSLKDVGVGVAGNIHSVVGVTSHGRGDGTSSDAMEQVREFALPEVNQKPAAGTSPDGVLSKKRLEELSAASIIGVEQSVLGKDFSPLGALKNIKNGDLELEIPVEGTLGQGYFKSADFEKGSTLKLQLQIRDGKVVADKTKAKFSQSGDGPLWVTARGAYFDEDNTLRLDLGGMKDLAVPGLEKMPLEMHGLVDRLQPQSGPGESKQSQASALKIHQARIHTANATFKAGEMDFPGGQINIAEDTQFTLRGTAQVATLSGRVKVSDVSIAADDLALKAEQGEADLKILYRALSDNTAEVKSSLKNLNLDLQYAFAKRDNGDYIHLAAGTAEQASLTTTTTLSLDQQQLPTEVQKSETEFDIPCFKGFVFGGRVTVPDADGTAQIELGDSEIDGTVKVGKDGVFVDAHLPELDLVVRDYAGKSKKGSADIDYARIKGSGGVRLSQDEGLSVEGQVEQVAILTSDIKTVGKNFDLDANRTWLTGNGVISFNSKGQLELDGDLHIDSTLDSAHFYGQALNTSGGISAAKGSRLVGDVTSVRVSKDGDFVVDGVGGVDFTVSEFGGEIAGAGAKGSARVYGGGRFQIDSNKGVKLPDQLNVDIDVDDAVLDAAGLRLDMAKGATVRTRIDGLAFAADGSPERVQFGPGTRFKGELDGGSIRLPVLQQPLRLAKGSAVDFQVDHMVLGTDGVREAQGKLYLEALLDNQQAEVADWAGVSGARLERVNDLQARLVLEIDKVVLREDGTFEVADTEFSLQAQMGEVTGRYQPE